MMKTTPRKILFTLILSVAFSFANAQTNVSGGIFANTTWTLANSPYIVVDTVVVFPGFTLTIEPGVVVKFANNKFVEIRQGSLIANGTSSDSITFTSNAITPSPGIWNRIWLNNAVLAEFNYCNIRYAGYGIYGTANSVKNSSFSFNTTGCMASYIDSSNFINNTNGLSGMTILRCNILHNQLGIIGGGTASYCLIDSNQTGVSSSVSLLDHCTINHNQKGVESIMSGANTYMNCIIDSNAVTGIELTTQCSLLNSEIKYNPVGVDCISDLHIITGNVIENNSVGIRFGYFSYTDTVHCNRICNNSTYDLQMTDANPLHAANNYWCTADSISTEAVIYDGHDNISLGLVSFMPLDTSCAPGIATYINETEQKNISFSIFPNPATSELVVRSQAFGDKGELAIFNLIGEKTLSQQLMANSQPFVIDVSTLSSGIYIIQIATHNRISRQKFIRQ